MRDALGHLPYIIGRIQKHGLLLMLDFDGVLAPIIPHHKDACMSAKTRALLAACARRGRVVVISGRSLQDVRRRVALPLVWYAGNHGAEWQLGKVRGRAEVPAVERRALSAARKGFDELAERYPGIEVEDKKLTLGIHFRAVPSGRIGAFRKEVQRIAQQFLHTLAAAEGIKLISVRPLHGRTKGDAIRMVRGLASKGLVPIFIGDDTTDEDAFRALPRGITIRVGIRRGSYAHFFLRTRADVDVLLAALAGL